MAVKNFLVRNKDIDYKNTNSNEDLSFGAESMRLLGEYSKAQNMQNETIEQHEAQMIELIRVRGLMTDLGMKINSTIIPEFNHQQVQATGLEPMTDVLQQA